MYNEANILCQQCICPACPLFLTSECLEGIDHCAERCRDAGYVERCWFCPEERS